MFGHIYSKKLQTKTKPDFESTRRLQSYQRFGRTHPQLAISGCEGVYFVLHPKGRVAKKPNDSEL